MPIQMDTSKTGLEMFFKSYQVHALNHLNTIHPRGANSRTVFTAVNQQTKISRASIINFLKAAADEGILTYTTTTCKGGHQRIYTLAHPGNGLKTYLAEKVLRLLNREYPEETSSLINKNKYHV